MTGGIAVGTGIGRGRRVAVIAAWATYIAKAIIIIACQTRRLTICCCGEVDKARFFERKECILYIL